MYGIAQAVFLDFEAVRYSVQLIALSPDIVEFCDLCCCVSKQVSHLFDCEALDGAIRLFYAVDECRGEGVSEAV